ncbi:MAG: pyridoxamine 5'-phosphate oxidase family protein [Campylobacteraceae bacterium]
MYYKNEFLKIMEEQKEMAVATSVDNIPNVRVLNFFYDNVKHTLYFATFKDNHLTKEISKNNLVSITTIPAKTRKHVRIIKGYVHRSKLSIFDVKDMFIKKAPEHEEIIEYRKDDFYVYEVDFSEAIVTIDFISSKIILA